MQTGTEGTTFQIPSGKMKAARSAQSSTTKADTDRIKQQSNNKTDTSF